MEATPFKAKSNESVNIVIRVEKIDKIRLTIPSLSKEEVIEKDENGDFRLVLENKRGDYEANLEAGNTTTPFTIRKEYFDSAVPEQLEVMSFNCRFDVFHDCCDKSWRIRAPLIIKTILKYKPALISLQETDIYQRQLLEKELYPFYLHFGIPRDGKKEEGNGILYRPDILTFINGENFALSDTPDVIGSSHWGEGNRRICTLARFKSPYGKDILEVFSIHLDYESEKSRINSIKLIKSKIKKTPIENVILIGDFNDTENSQTIQMTKEGMNQAGEGDPQMTFHNFTGLAIEKDDYIFVGENMKPTNYRLIKDEYDEVFPSDHFPIMCDILFN